ncbi:MAG: PilZ domain-containing protein [Vulcanimicrobiaceae bacterium]
MAHAANISVGGLMKSGDAALTVGTVLEVWLEIPTRFLIEASVDLYMHPRVVAHRPAKNGGYHYHLAFYGLRLQGHEQLTRVIRTAAGD